MELIKKVLIYPNICSITCENVGIIPPRNLPSGRVLPSSQSPTRVSDYVHMLKASL